MKKLTVLAILMLAIALVSACSREQFAGNPQAAAPAPEPGSASASSGEASGAATTADNSSPQQLPFSKPNPDGSTSPGRSSMLPSKMAENLSVPAGTPVAVRLQSAVSSSTSRSGERFDAVLAEPLVINGQTVAQQGAPVVGRVVAARQSGRLHNSGYIRLTLASVEINGKQVPMQTSSVFAAGASHKKRNWAWIGGSTAGGALIGGLAGGGKGALIGSAVGATGGTTAAYATGKKDVGFGAERRLTFRLVQPLNVKG